MKFSDEALRIVAEALPGTTIGEDGTRYINFDEMKVFVSGDRITFAMSFEGVELTQFDAVIPPGGTATLRGFQFRTQFKVM